VPPGASRSARHGHFTTDNVISAAARGEVDFPLYGEAASRDG